VLGLNYSGPDTEILSDMAGSQTRAWVEAHEQANDTVLPDDDVEEVRQAFYESLEDHWSLRNVILNKFDFDKLIDHLNAWSNRGMHSASYVRPIAPGDGILDWEDFDDGVEFTLADPFLITLIEANYCVTGASEDEDVGLVDVELPDFLSTIKDVYSCEGLEPQPIDLSDWDAHRVGMDDNEVLRRIAAGKRRRSRRRSEMKERAAG
jgi:hypothetical protein